MNRLCFFVLSVFCFPMLLAQDIPNPGFENWVQYGGYKDPEGWYTINSLTVLGGLVTVTQATGTDAHSGSYAMRLRSGSIFGQVAPGIAATGSINPTTQDIDGGIPYSLRPYYLVGWYKYEPAGTDTATISVSFTRWNSQTQQTEAVGEGVFIQTQTVNTYTEFGTPITYYSAELPDTMVIVILSSSGNTPVPNSTLYVDDLWLDFQTGAGSLPLPELPAAYPVPASDAFYIDNTGGQALYLQLWHPNGQQVTATPLVPGINHLNLEALPSGMYFYRLTEANGRLVRAGKMPVLR